MGTQDDHDKENVAYADRIHVATDKAVKAFLRSAGSDADKEALKQTVSAELQNMSVQQKEKDRAHFKPNLDPRHHDAVVPRGKGVFTGDATDVEKIAAMLVETKRYAAENRSPNAKPSDVPSIGTTLMGNNELLKLGDDVVKSGALSDAFYTQASMDSFRLSNVKESKDGKDFTVMPNYGAVLNSEMGDAATEQIKTTIKSTDGVTLSEFEAREVLREVLKAQDAKGHTDINKRALPSEVLSIDQNGITAPKTPANPTAASPEIRLK